MEYGSDEYRAFLTERREALLESIQGAAARSGRDASQITLLAVSKTVGNEAVLSAYRAGYRVFGENRPQELKKKVAYVRQVKEMEDVRFDMIGNLQKNKINQVLGNAHLVQSVSSVHLAEAISRRAVAQGKSVRCLLEVNVSGELSKSGVPVSQARLAMDALMGMEGIEPMGLMTMAPANDASAARATFSGLRDLRDDLKEITGLELGVLSCGMSGDYQIAVEEGSTLVRLGRIVFDPAYKSV
ncbi:MAG: YggS family pyridoxal phosphate-dependent enzyme [Coriobacteriales bacterium]|nr:YggS family pyridoxal phosphate-dependent enzyme [Coriobacteriales bacterium]